MSRIKNPKIHIQLAKSREQEGKYAEAAKSYQDASDWLNVIRLNLTHLNNATKAIEIVNKTKSTDGAAMIAKLCIDKKNYKRAVEFLIMAEDHDQAFELAQHHNEMSTYATAIGNKGSDDEYLSIAEYFENKGEAATSADYYVRVREYDRALKLYLKCGEDQVDKAIQVIGLANNDALTTLLIDFLMGDMDGAPKDPKHIFKLYMALGNFKQAAKTALLIAKQEQEAGNYLVAHQVLFEMTRELDKKKVHVPSDLRQALMLLHSYMIIKDLNGTKDLIMPAQMLIRISKNISKFPNSTVKILTSTVLQCIRAGLKSKAYEYAAVLVREENRSKIEEKYKSKIINFVRKKKEEDTVQEEMTPCPCCKTLMPETQLDCDQCQNHIPFCIASGHHMVLEDWSCCPHCEFSALFSKFNKVLQSNDSTCPMCKKKITKITKSTNASELLKKYIQ
ncbi:hypothetical protein AKO1_007082 [Acrasis kona]|uniref:IF140/IFT172/WDR19 TPR domain-containing protein n=1 Tax=Acrasis kona TaxID=1008807 RepID=A0AAW2YTC3_9EUKA